MIKDLKDLQKLLKLCRAQGVTEIKLGTCEIKLGDIPQDSSQIDSTGSDASTDDPYSNFPQGELTDTQLMYYSAGGDPNGDPENVQ